MSLTPVAPFYFRLLPFDFEIASPHFPQIAAPHSDAMRQVINDNPPEGYEEGIQFGMIGWYVPLSMYPAG